MKTPVPLIGLRVVRTILISCSGHVHMGTLIVGFGVWRLVQSQRDCDITVEEAQSRSRDIGERLYGNICVV